MGLDRGRLLVGWRESCSKVIDLNPSSFAALLVHLRIEVSTKGATVFLLLVCFISLVCTEEKTTEEEDFYTMLPATTSSGCISPVPAKSDTALSLTLRTSSEGLLERALATGRLATIGFLSVRLLGKRGTKEDILCESSKVIVHVRLEYVTVPSGLKKIGLGTSLTANSGSRFSNDLF